MLILSAFAALVAWCLASLIRLSEVDFHVTQFSGSLLLGTLVAPVIAIAAINGMLLMKRRITALRPARACQERNHV